MRSVKLSIAFVIVALLGACGGIDLPTSGSGGPASQSQNPGPAVASTAQESVKALEPAIRLAVNSEDGYQAQVEVQVGQPMSRAAIPSSLDRCLQGTPASHAKTVFVPIAYQVSVQSPLPVTVYVTSTMSEAGFMQVSPNAVCSQPGLGVIAILPDATSGTFRYEAILSFPNAITPARPNPLTDGTTPKKFSLNTTFAGSGAQRSSEVSGPHSCGSTWKSSDAYFYLLDKTSCDRATR